MFRVAGLGFRLIYSRLQGLAAGLSIMKLELGASAYAANTGLGSTGAFTRVTLPIGP